MNTKQNFRIITLMGILTLFAEPSKAVTIYNNNISALNINALSDTFMSYTNYGSSMSEMFENPIIYGTMRRIDEYGDDGSTLDTLKGSKDSNDLFIHDIWGNANHVNTNMHYGKNISKHARFNLATIGANTKNIALRHGVISFGAFAAYINTKVSDAKSNGDVVGIFSHYKYRNFGARTLTNIGSLNNTDSGVKYNNSWANVATDIYANLKLDDTLYVKPFAYIGYTWVSSDDVCVDGNHVTSNDYNFFNVAPGLSFIKEIVPNWYGAISGKYVAHFGGKNNIHVNGANVDGLDLDSYTDIGTDIEYKFKQFIFTGKVHALIGDIDGWDTNLNIKYVF